MIRNELKKLNRSELMDLIYQMKKNEERMKLEIAALQDALKEKRIQLSTAGSIADAAASITDVFSSAQKTADLYLQEISSMKEDTEKECAHMVKMTRQVVARVLADGEQQYETLKEHYREDYKKWLQLQASIEALEQIKANKYHEVFQNDKESEQ